MTDLLNRLVSLPKRIRFGIIGTGFLGEGIVYQASITPGIECVAITDAILDRAISCAINHNRDYVIVENTAEMHDAISADKLAVCSQSMLVTQCELVDVFVDATNSAFGGMHYALSSIKNHKHVVTMNTAADLIFGPYLLEKARQEGVIYTSGDGDQHTVLKRLINEIELWGFRTVMAGNIKGFLNRYSNPTTIVPEADKRKLDYRMCTSFTDGTKLNIEMALIANSIGGKTIIPGMLGPKVNDIYDIFQNFDYMNLWDGKTRTQSLSKIM